MAQRDPDAGFVQKLNRVFLGPAQPFPQDLQRHDVIGFLVNGPKDASERTATYLVQDFVVAVKETSGLAAFEQ